MRLHSVQQYGWSPVTRCEGVNNSKQKIIKSLNNPHFISRCNFWQCLLL